MPFLSYIECITLHCNFKICFATTVLIDRFVYKILYFIVGECMQYCYALLMLWLAFGMLSSLFFYILCGNVDQGMYYNELFAHLPLS